MLSDTDEEDPPLPITSYACQWKAPWKRKESDTRIADLKFEKHVYGHVRKHQLDPIDDFDPWPPQFRGKLHSCLPDLFKKVTGKGLGISVLSDPCTQVWSGVTSAESAIELPGKQNLVERVSAFIESLHVLEGRIREIEMATREQCRSPKWFDARSYRLTVSLFGEVLCRRPDTPPDSLVLRVIEHKQFTSPSTEYGKRLESTALEKYTEQQHQDITIFSAGFVIFADKPYFGATPDAYIHDPRRQEQCRLIEIKCPYKYRNLTLENACLNGDFCSTLSTSKQIQLKRNHPYYSQIQGQLAITGRKWCDFVIYTKR